MRVNISYHSRNHPGFVKRSEVTFTKKDFWSLHTTLATVIHPMLVEFRRRATDENIVSGYPANLVADTDIADEGYQRWLEILDKMIFAFEQILIDDLDIILEKEMDAKIQEGLDLFAQYFRSLWE